MKNDKGNCIVPWQEYSSNEKMMYLLNSGHLSDCCFVVGQGGNTKEFHCHKFVLIMASSIFETMFCGGFTEAVSSKPIPITDTEPEYFEYFLQFIYDPCQHSLRYQHEESDALSYEYDSRSDKAEEDHGRHKLFQKFMKYNVETLENLIYLGKKYLIPRLEKTCIFTLVNEARATIENESVHKKLKIFEFAVLNNYIDLMSVCAEHIDQCEAITRYTIFVICMDASLLIELIKLLKTTYSHDLLNFVNNYVKMRHQNNASDDKLSIKNLSQSNDEKNDLENESNNDFEIIQNLYEAIHFTDLSPRQFCDLTDTPELATYLSDKHKFDILKKLTKK